jgi:hypothetical protein
MRNRAKCKLCGDILESFHRHDYVSCKCGEISIHGGLDYLHAAAKNFDNFLRIDDDDSEIPVQYHEKNQSEDQQIDKQEEAHSKPDKVQLISMLDDLIKSYDNLPQHAMLAPVNHSDVLSVLMLVSSLFKSI